MKAIFQKEWRAYKNGLHAYATAALYLLVSGLLLVLFNLTSGSSNLLDAQSALSLFSLLFFPLLTAFSMPRERQSGTETLLFSLPLRTHSIVLGKFLALLSLFFLALLPSILLSLCFPLWGGSVAAQSLTVWIGYLSESLVLLSLCFFLSAIAPRPLISFGLSFGASLVLYLLWSFAPFLPAVLYSLNPFSIPSGFSYGRLDLVALLSALLLSALLLFLACLFTERRRCTLFGSQKSARCTRLAQIGAGVTAALIVTVSVLNACLPLLPQSAVNPILAKNETYEIDSATEKEIADLQKDVSICFLVNGGRAYAGGEIYSFLRSYGELSPRLKVKVVDTDDKDFLAAHGLDAESASGTIVVESSARFRTLTSDALYFYKNAEFGFDRMSVSEYLAQCEYVETYYGEEYLYHFVSTSTPYFDGESALSNAIRFVCADTAPIAYVLSSSGASPLDGSFQSSLERDGFAVHTLESASSVPDDCTLLILNAPLSDLSQSEADGLAAYLADGGKLFLTTAYQAGILPNLQTVLAEYGLTFGEEKVVCEGDTAYALETEHLRDYLFFAHLAPHALTEGFTDLFSVSVAHPIILAEKEGITVTPWLYTSQKGYLYDPGADTEAKDGKEDSEAAEGAPVEGATYTVGAIAETEETAILWISSPASATAIADSYFNSKNLSLIKTALSRTVGHTSKALPIDASPFDLQPLSLDTKTLTFLTVLLTVLLPVGVLGTGAIRYYVRKKR